MRKFARGCWRRDHPLERTNGTTARHKASPRKFFTAPVDRPLIFPSTATSLRHSYSFFQSFFLPFSPLLRFCPTRFYSLVRLSNGAIFCQLLFSSPPAAHLFSSHLVTHAFCFRSSSVSSVEAVTPYSFYIFILLQTRDSARVFSIFAFCIFYTFAFSRFFNFSALFTLSRYARLFVLFLLIVDAREAIESVVSDSR